MAETSSTELQTGEGITCGMLGSIHLQNYRGFRDYRLSDLSRINLLVGKNNSGKTSILEAVNLLAASGDPRVLSRIARQRGELIYEMEERESRRVPYYVDLSHFFHGHRFGERSQFVVSSDNSLGQLEVSAVSLEDVGEETQKLLFDEGISRAVLGLSIKTGLAGQPGTRTGPALPITEDGALSLDQRVCFYRLFRSGDDISIQFVSHDSLERLSMAEMWDKVATESKEQDVVAAMKILDDKLNSIVFLSGDRSYRYESRGGILLGFDGTQRRLPLGSYGEGMRRLLALALSLIKTQNGILLVDEIDTGLHYSIMGDMWRLVAQTAQRYNIQVFATTHSFDCVRGLDWLCRNHPDLGAEVSLQKIEPDLSSAIALDAEQIKISVEQDIEVR